MAIGGEGSIRDAFADVLAAAGGDTLYNLVVNLLGGKGGKLGESLKGIFEAMNKNQRSAFVTRFLKMEPEQQEIFDEIYRWWFQPAPEGAGRKENTFVTLVMMVEENDWIAFVDFITKKWRAGEDGRRSVRDLFYKLEHDWMDQYVEHDIVDPILKPLNEMISADLRKKRERRNLKMPVKPGRRFF